MSKHSISVKQDNLLHIDCCHEPLGLCRWEQGGREEAINSLAGVGKGPDLGWAIAARGVRAGSHEGQSEGLGTGLLWLASRPTLFPLSRYWKEHSDKQPLVQMLTQLTVTVAQMRRIEYMVKLHRFCSADLRQQMA